MRDMLTNPGHDYKVCCRVWSFVWKRGRKEGPRVYLGAFTVAEFGHKNLHTDLLWRRDGEETTRSIQQTFYELEETIRRCSQFWVPYA